MAKQADDIWPGDPVEPPPPPINRLTAVLQVHHQYKRRATSFDSRFQLMTKGASVEAYDRFVDVPQGPPQPIDFGHVTSPVLVAITNNAGTELLANPNDEERAAIDASVIYCGPAECSKAIMIRPWGSSVVLQINPGGRWYWSTPRAGVEARIVAAP